jgi:SAM-dependent methyltransferase
VSEPESASARIANEKAAAFWATAAPAWLDLEWHYEETLGEPGRWAMERLQLSPGASVVDLGCGSGRTTLELARRVGSSGNVVGVDITSELLENGQALARERGVSNVSFVRADIQVADLGSRVFDRAYSRMGVMFFKDPVAAFTVVRRALRDGGRLSFACFQSPSENEWLRVPTMAGFDSLGVSPPRPDPERPDNFSFADVERVRSILAAAGFGAVDIEARNDFVVMPEEQIAKNAAARTRVGVIAELLRDMDASGERRTQVEGDIERALRARVVDGEVRLSRGILLVAADVE